MLIIGGDVNLNRPAGRPPFTALAPLLDRADVRFVNLEGALHPSSTDPAHPDIPHKATWRHSDPAMVEYLTSAGVDAVSCANNVTYPAGAALGSLRVLDAAGIGHCGAGRNADEAYRPLTLTRRGTRYGFLAYTSIAFPYGHEATPTTPGVAVLRASTSYVPDPRVGEVPGRPPTVLTRTYPEHLARLAERVTALREAVDVLTVSCHWGLPGWNVADYQREIGRTAIDAGADLVVGHGPHSLGVIEVHAGRPILYSLGNLVFDWPRTAGRHPYGLLVSFDAGHATARAVRTNAAGDPEPCRGPEAAAVLREIVTESARRGTTLPDPDEETLVIT